MIDTRLLATDTTISSESEVFATPEYNIRGPDNYIDDGKNITLSCKSNRKAVSCTWKKNSGFDMFNYIDSSDNFVRFRNFQLLTGTFGLFSFYPDVSICSIDLLYVRLNDTGIFRCDLMTKAQDATYVETNTMQLYVQESSRKTSIPYSSTKTSTLKIEDNGFTIKYAKEGEGEQLYADIHKNATTCTWSKEENNKMHYLGGVDEANNVKQITLPSGNIVSIVFSSLFGQCALNMLDLRLNDAGLYSCKMTSRDSIDVTLFQLNVQSKESTIEYTETSTRKDELTTKATLYHETNWTVNDLNEYRIDCSVNEPIDGCWWERTLKYPNEKEFLIITNHQTNKFNLSTRLSGSLIFDYEQGQCVIIIDRFHAVDEGLYTCHVDGTEFDYQNTWNIKVEVPIAPTPSSSYQDNLSTIIFSGDPLVTKPSTNGKAMTTNAKEMATKPCEKHIQNGGIMNNIKFEKAKIQNLIVSLQNNFKKKAFAQLQSTIMN